MDINGYRVVRGHVRDYAVKMGFLYREGWWWHFYHNDPIGLDYGPEGPFTSKSQALRNLHWHKRAALLENNWSFFKRSPANIWPRYVKYYKKPNMKVVTGIIPIGKRLVAHRLRYGL